MIRLEERIKALHHLGHKITTDNVDLRDKIQLAKLHNPWFTEENVWKALNGIKTAFLNRSALEDWAKAYDITNSNPQRIGLVLAGNIPAVGWHDIMCCFIAGHISVIKLSDKDRIIIPYLLDQLKVLDNRANQYFKIVDKLKDFDAIIATGSNNTSKYFHYYFDKYPHIIRSNRNAVAVLTGNESDEDILNLGHDIFTYFGLGCRNVSSCFVPKDFDWERYLEIWHEEYKTLAHHNKYKNNFDHNISLYILNKETFLNNGCLLVKEDPSTASRIASLHYQIYNDTERLAQTLRKLEDQIQCIVSNEPIDGMATFLFGQAQTPSISDYADGVDTLSFLTQL